MNKDLPKVLAIGFGLALLVYVVSFSWIQHEREKKGPWTVAFQTDAAGVPTIVISEPFLKIKDQTIVFPENKIELTNFSESIVLDKTTTNAPFGQIVFQDPTFLPGTITFNFFGHEVELMPRTLIIDKQEYTWNSNPNIPVTGQGKYTPAPKKKSFLNK